jgi:outer membrane protein OmpA-like peptidoglycan-associated protein
MASKKYISLLSLLFLLVSASQAQLGGTYDVQDSSVVPSKRLPQHTEFMANNYPYPAKPRNQWEIGLQAGAFSISGDVRNRFPGLGVALHARKALGYVFSLRGQVGYGMTKGLNFQPSSDWTKNPAWAANGYTPGSAVFYNYKTSVIDASLQGVVTLSNIRFHKAKSSFNIYAFAGFGGMIYNTKIDALDGNGNPYNFSSVTANYGPTGYQYKDRKKIKKDLKNILDGKYETTGETDPGQPKLFKKPFRPIFDFGAGVQFKLNKKFSLAVEDKVTIPKTDLLDGQQWQENGVATTVPGGGNATAQTRDFDTYNFLSVGINMAVGGKAVEPLWWLNPLDYAYNEINKPRHMKLPKPVLDDADGDGITDQFDQEPNTPAGAPVDSHGVSLDTDGDGVPDYKDKEKITPTQCQPVDADGVGKCPPPACCDSIAQNMMKKTACGIGDLPSVTFKAKSIALSNDAKALLSSAAQKIKDNPNCKIAVIGYCASSKAEQQLSWDRVNAVISYLVDKEGINQDRFIFKYGETGGDCNTVDLRDGTGEEGPTTVPAPHPNLRRGR